MISGRNIAIALTLLVSAPALADEYSEFRIPTHRLFGWSANLSTSALRDVSSTEGDYGSRRATGGALGTQGFWISDSDPSRTSVGWSASVRASRSSLRDDRNFYNGISADRRVEDLRDRQVGENWQLSLERRIYPRRPPFTLEFSATGAGGYDQMWHRQRLDGTQAFPDSNVTQAFELDLDQWRYQYHASGSVAFGVGRVRDATGVLDARVYEERLSRAGVLTRPLSQSARERLAALAYVRYAYVRVHDRAGKYLMREIERILREDGALANGLVDPSAALRGAEPYLGPRDANLLDPIPRSPVARSTGWFAGLVVAAGHDHFIERVGTSQFDRFSNDDSILIQRSASGSLRNSSGLDRASGGGRAEFHAPFGPRWQLDATAQVLAPLETPAHGFDLTTDLGLMAIAADRWTARTSVSQSRTTQDSGARSVSSKADRWAVSFGANLTIYIEDRLQLAVLAVERQRMDRTPASSGSLVTSRFASSGQISLELTYRLLGGLDAPGLITPLRIGTGAF